MTQLQDIVAYCNLRLDVGSFDDYCPNGLQVEGRPEVGSIVSGVTASRALIDAAAQAGADLLLVHHGYFWRGEPAPLVGVKGRRVKALLAADISLLAYHLPLDAHPDLGNNRQLAIALGFDNATAVDGLLWGVELSRAMPAADLVARVDSALGRKPLVIGPQSPVRRIAWCTGAAQGMIGQAAAAGLDAFISGEVSEQTVHEARELEILYLSAGHHATERYGVQALGSELAERFGLNHRFIDISNPV
ncbi:MAG: Nif3-like dinuclear metal center hexameric protein [Sedimenticolaceae bacterium]